jgi:hypothetical protein
MKKLIFLIVAVAFVISMGSCKKDENKTDYFSFQGKDYTIDEVALIDLVLNSGQSDETILHLLTFANNTTNDTTLAVFTLLDTKSNILSGNYPSIDQGNSNTATRAIVPFALIALSGILYQDGSSHLTGDGGSIDISVSGSQYEINMNDISVGDYADLFDSNPQDGNYGYSKAGEIKGNFSGTITKQTEILSLALKNKIGKLTKVFKDISK